MRVRRPRAEYFALARGVWALAAAEVGISLNMVVPCATALGVRVGGTTQATGSAIPHVEVQRAARVAWRLTSALGERNRCLRHSLIIGHLLRAHAPTLCFGVRRGEKAIEAHAWIEVGGVAVGRDATINTGAFVALRRAG